MDGIECLRLYDKYIGFPGTPLDKEKLDFHDIYADLCELAYKSKIQDKFDKPMLWIGIYITVASLLCTFLMGADLLHGFQNRKLWFPCKYFNINASSLMVITVALKLPVDLSNMMPTMVDKLANWGGMMFICTMMVNLMPSLASMNNKELVTNFIALGIMVVTVAVNVCININIGVAFLYQEGEQTYQNDAFMSRNGVGFSYFDYSKYGETVVIVITTIYVTFLLLLLVILMSSTLAIPTSKYILECKYQACHQKTSDEQELQHTGMSTIERIAQNVSRYGVMVETGSPQFVVAVSPTCRASGVICFFMALFHLSAVTVSCKPIVHPGSGIGPHQSLYPASGYKWSTLMILVTQAIGVLVGTIAPFFRCFAALNFKLSKEWSRNHIKVFRVESYWTQKLSDWKQTRLPFPITSRRWFLVHHLKNLILSCCIVFQKTIVVACKAIGLIPILFVIFFVYLKRMFFGEPHAARTLRHEQYNKTKDLRHYVLQINDEVEIAERSLEGISKSLNHLIKKAEKHRPNNLLEFLEKAIGVEGVEQPNNTCLSLLPIGEPLKCWSLAVINLISIAIAIPNISIKKANSLISSADEGLEIAGLVEESLDDTRDSVKFHMAAKKLWLEVAVCHRWLKNDLQEDAFNGKTSEEALMLLMDRANDIISKHESKEDGPNGISFERTAANSMNRITTAILLFSHGISEPISEEKLFKQLSTMIAEVLCDCFTKLPQVIEKKCRASAIEKREESIKAAAQLLGQTKEIMNKFQACEINF